MTDRSDWPTAKKTLAQLRTEVFPEDLSATTTPEERIAMMWQLAVDAWTMRGEPIPEFDRQYVRITRRNKRPSNDATD